MKVVKCINDDYSETKAEWAKNALIVGEAFPVKGETYVVDD